MPYVTVSGISIYVESTIGNSLPIVFVHGAGGSSKSWSEQLVSDSQYNSWALDLPGHGKSEGSLLSNIKDMAEFINDFIKALTLEKFVLVGHSMGGAIVQEFALQYPEKLRGLVLIATGARLKVSKGVLSTLATGNMPFKDVNHLYGSSTSDDKREEAMWEMNEISPTVYWADFEACNKFDRVLSVGKIKVPSLIIVGDEDVMTPLKYSQFLSSNLPNSQLRIIKGAGHMCMLEKPTEVTTELERFIRNCVD
ncbi:alpha/beta fold hydrolase [Desulfosporosinus fructosivorans]|uniref:alpha/beta fold hydrolase n=1 Tax=Desulfosporosinus fructosivorans TaxID=2018669 RepID=UPI00130E765A|nr:alpha/beta hydrolase [Desulfosporosinus fructosivorans]